MRFIFRTDASPVIGAGHAMRIFALAEEATLRGIECVLVGSLDGLEWVKESFNKIGCTVTPTHGFDKSRVGDVLILDSYQVSPGEAFITGNNWGLVISIADAMTPDYGAHLVFHPGLKSDWFEGEKKNFRSGPRYIPIRKSLMIKTTRSSTQKLKIIIFGGGSDFFGFAEKMAHELTHLSCIESAVFFSTNNSLIEHIDPRFKVLPFGIDLDEQLKLADLVFTTASTSSLELIAREIPVAIGCSVDNQNENYDALVSAGVAAGIGHRISTGEWNLNSKVIERLVEDSNFRAQLQRAASQYIDLNGAKRIVDEILEQKIVC